MATYILFLKIKDDLEIRVGSLGITKNSKREFMLMLALQRKILNQE